MGNCCDSNHGTLDYSAQKRTHKEATMKASSMHSCEDRKPTTLDKVMMVSDAIDQVQDVKDDIMV